MEKSIEKRAYDYANKISKHYPTPDSEVIFKSSYDNYVEIATEQRKIDIEQAKKSVCQDICTCRTKCKEPNMNCEMIFFIVKSMEE